MDFIVPSGSGLALPIALLAIAAATGVFTFEQIAARSDVGRVRQLIASALIVCAELLLIYAGVVAVISGGAVLASNSQSWLLLLANLLLDVAPDIVVPLVLAGALIFAVRMLLRKLPVTASE